MLKLVFWGPEGGEPLFWGEGLQRGLGRKRQSCRVSKGLGEEEREREREEKKREIYTESLVAIYESKF